MIHGGIDGYSRLPVYLKCAANNLAATVLECFTDAVSIYGLPLRVRSDMGGENFGVAQFMWSQPEREASSVIMGRSVHNQRIERLWRDVFQGCTSLYYQLFSHLEAVGLLDPCSEIHLFALHFVYISRIQRSLEYFRTAYIHHPMSSCHNSTPAQLYFTGLQNAVQRNRSTADQLFEVGLCILCILCTEYNVIANIMVLIIFDLGHAPSIWS